MRASPSSVVGTTLLVQMLEDAAMAVGHPIVTRLQELLAERGWTGWTQVERA